MSPFINTICSFDYDAKDIPKKCGAKAEMPERRLLLKFEHHFSPAKNSSPHRGVWARIH